MTVCAADDDTTGNCKTAPVTITNIAPTAAINKTGSTLIAGLATFLAHKGTAVPFAGRSQDPGSDDITQSWDWGDGVPSPDRVTTSFNNAPTNTADPDPSPSVNPRDVTDATNHVFADACLYTVTFGSYDDDNGTAPNDSVVVIITENASDRRGPGYWQTQYRPRPTAFSETQRQCYLATTRQLSAVFSEARALDTVKQAFDVMTLSKNGGSAQQKLDRQLLNSWLNFANGSIDLTTLIDTNGDSVPDTAFATVMANAEAVRLNPASTSAQLTAQTEILERINGV